MRGWVVWASLLLAVPSCGGQASRGQPSGGGPSGGASGSGASAGAGGGSSGVGLAGSGGAAQPVDPLVEAEQVARSCFRVTRPVAAGLLSDPLERSAWENQLVVEASAFGADVRFVGLHDDVLLAEDPVAGLQWLITVDPSGLHAVCPLDALQRAGLWARDLGDQALLACDDEACWLLRFLPARTTWDEPELPGQRAQVVRDSDVEAAEIVGGSEVQRLAEGGVSARSCVLSEAERRCYDAESEQWVEAELDEGLPEALLSLCPDAGFEPALPPGVFHAGSGGGILPGLAWFGVSVTGSPFALYSQLDGIPSEELSDTSPEFICESLPPHLDAIVDGGHFGWWTTAHVGYDLVALLTPDRLYGNWLAFVVR